MLQLKKNKKYPKYLQLADALAQEIEKGKYEVNDKLPSVKQLKELLKINAETVFNAYKHLRERGIIESDERRGYYVSSTEVFAEYRVLLLFDKLTSFKQVVYNSIVEELGNQAKVDIYFHHHNVEHFSDLLLSNIDKYSHFVVVAFVNGDIRPVLNQVAPRKLFLIDTDCPGLDIAYGGVFQNFYDDIFQGLETGLDRIKKYNTLILATAPHLTYLPDRERGFVDFCAKHKFKCQVVNTLTPDIILPGRLYILQSDEHLSFLIRVAREKHLKPGHDIGIISYNQSPLLEWVEGGISVLSSDFRKMGKTAARLILQNSQQKIDNDFELIIRNSI